MTRTDVIARILDRVQIVTGAAPGEVATDKPLAGQQLAAGTVDSLDMMEIEMDVEDEFDIRAAALDLRADCSVEDIADAVIAATNKGIS